MTDMYRRIEELVKPFAYTCDVRTVINLTGPMTDGPIEVRCHLKPDTGTLDREPKFARAAMFGSAQSIIEAIEEDGFTLTGLRIQIDGDAAQPPCEEQPRLVIQGFIEMHLKEAK